MKISVADNGLEAHLEGDTLTVLQSSDGCGWQGVGFSDVMLGRNGRCEMRQTGVQLGVCLDPKDLEYSSAGTNTVLAEDSFVVFEPGSDYTGRWTDEYRTLALNVAPETIERTFHLPLTSVHIEPQFVPAHQRAAAAHLLAAVSADLEAGNPNGPVLAESVTTTLLQSVARVPLGVRRRPTSLSSCQAADLRDLIAAQLAETLSLQMLADSVNLSVGHLVRSFKATFGITPHRYILRERVACAEALIRARQLSLKEIARASGFSDQSQMARTFRQLVGYTPRDVIAADLPLADRPIGNEP